MANDSELNRAQQYYIPVGSFVATIIALMTFWISFSNYLDKQFDPIRSDIRVIREAIVQHHGGLNN